MMGDNEIRFWFVERGLTFQLPTRAKVVDNSDSALDFQTVDRRNYL